MAIQQEVMIDEVRRNLLVKTSIDQCDLQASYNQEAFMAQVHRDIALKVAGMVFKQIAPAIDAAMSDIKFTEDKEQVE